MIDLTELDERTRGQVMAAVAGLETADAPLEQHSYPGLDDAAMRRLVEEVLRAGGRCLLDLGDGRWLSGYDDDVADQLTAQDVGTLAPVDRAVLALVLLHTVAIPRAEGRIQNPDWTDAVPVDMRTLCLNRDLPNGVIQASVRRLKARGILRRGHRADIVPGPQLLRLTEQRSRLLWEDLVVLCKPDGARAAQIRRNRTRSTEVAA